MGAPTQDPPTVPEPSTIEVVPHPDNITVMHLSGPLNRGFAPLARAEIAAAIEDGHPHLILDVNDVPSIDGAGAHTLSYGMHRARHAGGDLSIVAPTAQVAQRLAQGFHQIPSHATVMAALEADAMTALDAGTVVHGRVADAVVHEIVADAPALTETQLTDLEKAVQTERRTRSWNRHAAR